MALGEENGGGIGATMLVSPTGGNFNTGYPAMYPMPIYGTGNNGGGMGFGGDWGSLITLFLLFGLFGGGFGGGMGGFGGGYDFPWLLNGQQGINNNVSSGFRDAQITDNITSVRDGISNLSTQLCGCCSDMQMSMLNGFNGVNSGISNAQNALAQQMYTNQIADLERSYAAQTANTAAINGVNMSLQNCCCENRAATADLKYTLATEECQTRSASAMNTRDIIDSQTRGTQAILDKLCALELDGVKGQLAQAQRENTALQNAVNIATMQASQVAQTAELRASQQNANAVLLNELRSCPIPAQPVYGNSPIFQCPVNLGNNGCGCGCN